MTRKSYVPPEEAAAILQAHVAVTSAHETLPLMDALGRCAGAPLDAPLDMPPFHRSPLDGYAAHHLDVAEASESAPARLRIVQSVYAGDAPQQPLARGEAALVMTGSPLPEGATCVYRQEDVRVEDGSVLIPFPLREHANFCFRGEDIAAGTPLVQAGDALDFGKLTLLWGQGITQVDVYRRPRLGVLCTGSELAEPGGALPPGKIFDTNRMMLCLRAREVGAEVAAAESVRDDPGEIAARLTALAASCDCIVTTGGVSVGERDYMPAVMERLGGEELFRGVGMKPGGPALAFLLGSVPVLALSGNPFASFATFELIGIPTIKKIGGYRDTLPVRAKGILQGSFPKHNGSRRMLRARMEGDRVFFPGDGHASGMIGSLAGCNCLIDLPGGTPPLEPGASVEVFLFA